MRLGPLTYWLRMKKSRENGLFDLSKFETRKFFLYFACFLQLTASTLFLLACPGKKPPCR